MQKTTVAVPVKDYQWLYRQYAKILEVTTGKRLSQNLVHPDDICIHCGHINKDCLGLCTRCNKSLHR